MKEKLLEILFKLLFGIILTILAGAAYYAIHRGFSEWVLFYFWSN